MASERADTLGEDMPERSTASLFGRRAGDGARPVPVLAADATVADAVGALGGADASAVIVVDGGRRPCGILTERDVTRRVALKGRTDWPIARVMTSPVATIRADEFLYRAVARMRVRAIRHLAVVDDEGRLVGLVTLDGALAATSDKALRHMEALGGGEAIEGLARTKAAEAGIAADLLGEGMDAPSILALLVDINRDIHRRILERAVAATAESGLGAPPVAFTGLLLGSAGRGESLLGPDQDNALILDDYGDDDHTRIDAWFVALAERFTRDLASVGFPLCTGNVMATNPVWRKTAAQWRRQMTLWAERRSPVAVLFADIFFDFHSFAGDPARADALRAHVLDCLARNPAFLAEIAGTQANHAVAVGLFGRLQTVHGDPGRRGHVDLKLGGLMPLVGAVRLLALRARIVATGTVQRLAALADSGLVEPDRRDGLVSAFGTLAGLLLRQQIADLRAGRRPGNDILPDKLRRRSRDDLVEALRAVRSFHNAVIADFTGRLW